MFSWMPPAWPKVCSQAIWPSNVFLLGVAYQAGLIPLTAESIEEAIRLNKVEAERNVQAFLWGRRYYDDAPAVEQILEPARTVETAGSLIERRTADLVLYQDASYAAAYRSFMEAVGSREPALAAPVARYLYKLMAYKDEYEVARLLTRPEFDQQLRDMWEDVESVEYNLHPPLLRALGRKKKMKLGGWFADPLRKLASWKTLRGTPWDIFGYASLRRQERALIVWYRDLVGRVMDRVTADNLRLAIEILSLPDQIRGYENIKIASIKAVKQQAEEKLAQLAQVSLPVLGRP